MSIHLNHGTLQIEGSHQRENITLRSNPQQIEVDINGETQTFDPEEVQEIEINGLGGGDTIHLQALNVADTPLESVNIFNHDQDQLDIPSTIQDITHVSPSNIEEATESWGQRIDHALGFDDVSQEELRQLQQDLQKLLQELGGQPAGSKINNLGASLEEFLRRLDQKLEELTSQSLQN